MVIDAPTNRSHVDPVTVEVVRYGLVAAAEQMATAIERSARSQVIRDMLDYSTALFDLSGGIVAQSCRIPIHLNSMTRALRSILSDYYPLEAWGEGDIFCTNDPYTGGQHLPDIMAFRLAVADGEPVAICGTLGHHLDVGGRGPGSYGADATEVYQEGFRITPCRIATDGRLNPLFFQLLRPNIRVPDKTVADLRAQFAALEIGLADVQRMVHRYGTERFREATAEIIDQSEQRMRQTITSLPEGTFTAEDWVDGDGLEDEPIRVRVAFTRQGSDLIVDFDGTGDQARGPINCPIAATESAVYFALLSVLGPDLSSNHGCYKPIHIRARPGSAVNPTEPAPVVGRNVVAHRIVTVLYAALGQAVPGRGVADYYGNSNVYIISSSSNHGRPNVLFEIEVGGWGARADRDGNDCMSAGVHNLMNNPIELTEEEFPIRVLSYTLSADSGGAGQYRGGLGVRRVMEMQEDCIFSAQFDRVKYAPRGHSGGADGARARILVVQDGVEKELPGKILAHPLKRGDQIVIETQGGGGFGPPSARTKDAIERDMLEGKLTEVGARAAYPQFREAH